MAAQKSWAEVYLMPIVVALVGLGGTFFITNQQQKSAQIAAKAQIESAKEQAAADRQVKILDIFSEKITSADTNQRILALRMLGAVEPDLATKLALAVSEAEASKSDVKLVAEQVVEESTARAAAMSVKGFDFVLEECAEKRCLASVKASVKEELVVLTCFPP